MSYRHTWRLSVYIAGWDTFPTISGKNDYIVECCCQWMSSRCSRNLISIQSIKTPFFHVRRNLARFRQSFWMVSTSRCSLGNVVVKIDTCHRLRSWILKHMPQNTFDDESKLVEVMDWCRWATIHHMGQCWLRSMSPYDVTEPQWDELSINLEAPGNGMSPQGVSGVSL